MADPMNGSDGLKDRRFLIRVLARHLAGVQAAADAVCWLVAIPFATLLRYEFHLDRVDWSDLAVVMAVAALTQVLVGHAVGLYRRQWRYGSFDEVRAMAVSAVATAMVAVVFILASGAVVPRSVPISSGFLALVGMAGLRYLWRLYIERTKRPAGARPILVFGAGEGGVQAIRSMLVNPSSPYVPVALLDDDPDKRHLRINGVRVQGTRHDIIAVAKHHGVETVLIAIPSATAEFLRELIVPAVTDGLEVLVVPPVDEVFGSVSVADIRPLSEEDLLGRHPTDIDVDAIAHYVTGKCVLVTGAGGSIGSELCRQLTRFSPAQLVMVDRDESGLHAVQLSLEGRALLDDPRLVVADIRDRERIFDVFADMRPDVVFHAAALKHLPLLEMHPEEAWKTNVLGTQNVLDAAIATGAARVVNISTDKAADPTSALGHSKRVTERLTARAAEATGRPYVSVRFGNVLGSRGSMLGTFQAQIDAGGPVTVTHSDVTRYFMTIHEAVRLVIQAGAVGEPGEVLVLDMGSPVRIDDVARRLVERAKRPVRIVYTGLRQGEKLHEVLLASGETDERPNHPMISQVPVPPLSIDEARAVVHGTTIDKDALRRVAEAEGASALPDRRS